MVCSWCEGNVAPFEYFVIGLADGNTDEFVVTLCCCCCWSERCAKVCTALGAGSERRVCGACNLLEIVAENCCCVILSQSLLLFDFGLLWEMALLLLLLFVVVLTPVDNV